MISGSMAFSTDSMVGTSWGMHLGMTGTGMLLIGSDDPMGRCTFILISFLFFLAGGRGRAEEKKRGGKEKQNRETDFTYRQPTASKQQNPGSRLN